MDRFAQIILAAARQAPRGLRLRLRARGRAGRRVDRDRHRRPAVLPGLLRRPSRARARPRQPVLDPVDHPEHGRRLGLDRARHRGPSMSQCTACAAANMAIGDAIDEIRIGRADVMFAGGPRRRSREVGIAGFDAMRALSRRNDDPERASRPFEKDRDGLVMGRRRLRSCSRSSSMRGPAERDLRGVLGYGISADAAHITEPDPTGVSPARAMTMALADAGVDPTEIGYVNAHATSTPIGDLAETRVIKLALGEEHAHEVAVSSTKGATGHCFGAAGAVEAVFTPWRSATRSRRRRSTTRAGPLVRPRLRPERPAQLPEHRGRLSNSFGFGGHNATIVLRRSAEPHVVRPRGLSDPLGDIRLLRDAHRLERGHQPNHARLRRRLGAEKRPAATLLARYHALEPEVEGDGSRRYREVMGEVMRRLGAPVRGRSRGVTPAPGGPFPRSPAALADLRERGWRLAILSNSDPDLICREQGAPRRRVSTRRRRLGDPVPTSPRCPLGRVLRADTVPTSAPRSRRGEPLPRHRPRRRARASDRRGSTGSGSTRGPSPTVERPICEACPACSTG